ncbi:hypothetical protein MFLO_11240 [Listeria floridensis FSL S10-1187]|uniref:Uncharacterized protein n=1 Tax=Listeria floridensis FSL S10-1187 TaxID=1265817 RepID=A0ABN0RDP2_9LIST|nr:hypothetical protein MFLO_11240 [Listeria floridensis FSL S10-1187]
MKQSKTAFPSRGGGFFYRDKHKKEMVAYFHHLFCPRNSFNHLDRTKGQTDFIATKIVKSTKTQLPLVKSVNFVEKTKKSICLNHKEFTATKSLRVQKLHIYQ